jgi:hypothetical protein
MIAYYEITEALKDFLQNDPEVNTVELRGIDDIDTSKTSIFALGHIMVENAEFIDGVARFSIRVSVMDLVDERRVNINDIPVDERWKGIDNRQDVLNTTLSVIERLVRHIQKGSLASFAYELQSHSAEPFEERFENLLTGWTASMVIDVPNTIQNC